MTGFSPQHVTGIVGMEGDTLTLFPFSQMATLIGISSHIPSPTSLSSSSSSKSLFGGLKATRQVNDTGRQHAVHSPIPVTGGACGRGVRHQRPLLRLGIDGELEFLVVLVIGVG